MLFGSQGNGSKLLDVKADVYDEAEKVVHVHGTLNKDLWEQQVQILYTCAIFFLGVCVRHATNILNIPVPYTVNVFLLGVVCGFLPVGAIAEIGPYTIIVVFIPVLIFEGAFAIDSYVFKHIFVQVLLMAFPALVLMIVLTAVVSKWLFGFSEWGWKESFLFGSILSATDPVAVVAIMKELGVKKQLSLLIEGESMLNDGTAMVFFEIFHRMLISDEPVGIYNSIVHLLLTSLGGPAFGIAMGKLAIFWLQWTFNDSLTEISITLCTSYLTFYIAEEVLHISGVLAVVACGVTIKDTKICISPEVEPLLHGFWETLAFLANTLIFFLCGVIISQNVLHVSRLNDLVILFILYIMVNAIRAITFFLFSPILRRTGYGLTWQDGLVASWSGLRGAVGLALALIVYLTLKNEKVKQEMLFLVSSIVVLTLFINATTVASLLNYLGFSGVSTASQVSMRKAINHLNEGRRKSISIWKIDRFLSNTNWDVVRSICTIKSPYAELEPAEDQSQRPSHVTCPNCKSVITIEQKATHEMKAVAVRKSLKLFKDYQCEGVEDNVEDASLVEQTACYRWSHHGLLVMFVYGMEAPIIISEVCLYLTKTMNKDVDYGLDNTVLIMMMVTSTFLCFRIFVQGQRYIRTPWFGVALIINILYAADIFMGIGVLDRWFLEKYRRQNFWSLSTQIILMRLIYLIPLLEPLHLLLNYLIMMKKKSKLKEFYDVSRAYINACEIVVLNIKNISDNELICASIQSHTIRNKVKMLRELGLLQGYFPNVAVEMKTAVSIRSVLNVMRDAAYDMLNEGKIDDVEGALFIKVIESKMKRLKAAPPILQAPSINKILGGIAWVENDQALIRLIQSTGEILSYNYNSTLFQAGDPGNGIYFVLSGLLRVESHNELGFAEIDFLASGNAIGEISALTGTTRVATVKAETTVEVIFLPTEQLMVAMRKFTHLKPPLHVRLWRLVAVRVAAKVLAGVSFFQGYTKKALLEMFELFDMKVIMPEETFDLTNRKDVILITGTAIADGTEFEAPCYIPSNVQMLNFAPDQKPEPVMFYHENFSTQPTRVSNVSVDLADLAF